MVKTKNGVGRMLKRAGALFLTLVMLFSLGVMYSPAAMAVTQQQITDLRNKEAALQKEKASVQKKIDGLSSDKANAVQEKTLLEQKINVLREQIAVSQAAIDSYTVQIAEKEKELEAAKAEEARYYQLFCDRVRDMEEVGEVSYWSVLFQASSFSDMLDRMTIVSEVMEYDNGIMDALAAARQAVADAKAGLEESKAAEEQAQKNLKSQKAELDSEMQKVDSLIAHINANYAQYEQQMEDIEANDSALVNQISAAEKQYAAQLAAQKAKEEAERKAAAEKAAAEKAAAEKAAAQKAQQQAAQQQAQQQAQSTPTPAPTPVTPSGGGSKGGFSWPVPSSRHVSSGFAYRNCPYHGHELHGGIDIAASYGAPIIAAKGGVILISAYGSSYGNYVVIGHGDGSRTLYGHMSSRAVSAGQSVSQGQTIGYIGSTGNSTGNHCHFEVWTNSSSGSKVNPMQYF